MRRQQDIQRARWQLWAVTFAILGALVAVLLVVSSGVEDLLPQMPYAPPGALRYGLAGLVLGFALYTVDRERQLRRLADSLTEERIEAARLSEELRYLSDLTRERDTNAALLEGSVDGVAVIDRGLRVVRVNAALSALCGVAPAHASGADVRAVLPLETPLGEPLDGDAHPAAIVLSDASPRPAADYLLRLPNGGQRWVGATFSPIREIPGGQPVLVLVILRDVTAQKETEAMQRDFVSIVSHELRAPLTAIKGFAKTLVLKRDTIGDEQRHRYLATVNEQADRLSRLVEELLQVSRIDARRLRLEPAPVDVGELASALVAQFATKWAGRDIRLRVPDGTVAWADRGKLEEVLINLIDNAVKYSGAGAPVTVRAAREAGEVEVSIDDRGLGIAPEHVANLFQKFHRVSTPQTRDIGGTGLGLYIVKGLVEAQGGRVWVESVPGAGSTFSFALPAAEAQTVARDAPSEASA